MLVSHPGNATSIAVGDGDVYWTQSDGVVSKVPEQGGQVITVAAGLCNPVSLTANDKGAFWVDHCLCTPLGCPATAAEVWMAPFSPLVGGAIVTVAAHQPALRACAIGVDAIYCIRAGDIARISPK